MEYIIGKDAAGYYVEQRRRSVVDLVRPYPVHGFETFRVAVEYVKAHATPGDRISTGSGLFLNERIGLDVLRAKLHMPMQGWRAA